MPGSTLDLATVAIILQWKGSDIAKNQGKVA